jgi:cytochrome c553
LGERKEEGPVRKLVALFSLGFVLSIVTAAQSQEGPPPWAYPVNPPDFKPTPDDGSLRHVPDSTAGFTLTQLQDFFFGPDWHPDDHPPMPDVVTHGRKPDVFACGFCHRADGPGGPENARLAGLPATYIVQQMADFKSGARGTSVPKRNIANMVKLSKAISEEEIASAVAYFSGLKPRKVMTVVETDLVPKTYVANWFLAVTSDGSKEPIGNRIIEVPKNLEQFESRDARAEFIAYVPIGSVAKGEALVTTGGNGKTTQCGICHGPDLGGLGPIPGIAGRSPSYVVRQLYDIQHGNRAGPWSPLMVGVVAKLNEDDLISVAAYLASLPP